MSSAHRIRYVCLSDLHLGEEKSLLTCLAEGSYESDASQPGPVLEQLVNCLGELLAAQDGGRRASLIVNGDVLELAFGTFNKALMSFERLVEGCLAPGNELFDGLIYLPGNHDHHIWEIARETQYVNTVLKKHHPDGLPPPMHATPLALDRAVPSYLLNQLVRHARQDDAHPVLVAYPNLLLPPVAGSRRHVVIHHGHYVESLYSAISHLRRWIFPDRAAPTTVQQLEAENFAWIEFVWSLLGRSGDAGSDVEAVFEMIQYREPRRRLARNLADRIAAARDVPWVPEFVERLGARSAILKASRLVSGCRCKDISPLSQEIRDGLTRYLFGPTFRQLEDELGEVPEDLVFLFGHTHKPLADEVSHPQSGQTVTVFNSGGWTVDGIAPHPTNGASILLIGEGLELAALSIFQDAEDGDPAEIRLDLAPSASEGDRRFHAALAARIFDSEGYPTAAWRRLGEEIRSAIRVRRQHHRELYGDDASEEHPH